MEPFLVVARADRLGNLALDLEARQKRLEELRARDPARLADGERRDERRHRRVRQQTEDTVGARRELRVVPVERMAARAVHERRRRRTGLERPRPEHGGVGALIRALHVRIQDRAGVLRRAREQHAEAVDDAAFGDRDRVGG